MGNTLSADVKLFPLTQEFGYFSGNRPIGAGSSTGTDVRSILVPRRYRQHMFFVTFAVSRSDSDNGAVVQWISDVGRDGLQWVLDLAAQNDSAATALIKPWFWELPSDAADDTSILIAAQWAGAVKNRGLLVQGVYVDYNAPRGKERLVQQLSRWASGGGVHMK